MQIYKIKAKSKACLLLIIYTFDLKVHLIFCWCRFIRIFNDFLTDPVPDHIHVPGQDLVLHPEKLFAGEDTQGLYIIISLLTIF